MAKLREMFPLSTFRASDLNGQPLVLTTAGVTSEELFDKPAWVLWFVEDGRGLKLNFRNAECLALATKSENSSDWAGLKVKLTPAPFTSRTGEPGTMIVLEVLPAAAPEAKPAGNAGLPKPTNDLDDGIPF
jgi:hypothetical protein